MKEELRLLVKKTETQKETLKLLIYQEQDEQEIEKYLAVKRFIDGFLEDLKKIQKL